MARNINKHSWKDLRDLIREEYSIKSIVINKEFIECKNGNHAYRLQFLEKEREWKLTVEQKDTEGFNEKVKKAHVASRESISEMYEVIILRHNKLAKKDNRLKSLHIEEFMQRKMDKSVSELGQTVKLLSEEKFLQKRMKSLNY